MEKFVWSFLYPGRLCPFEKMLGIQGFCLWSKVNGNPSNFVIFAEHDHIYTYDEATFKPEEFFRDENDETGSSLPAPLYAVKKRAGSITYHGPGQLVCYLIADMKELGLKSPHHLARTLDDVIKQILARFGIQGYSLDELCAIDNATIRQELVLREILSLDARGNLRPSMSPQGVWVVHAQDTFKKIASRGLRIHTYRYGENQRKYFTTFGFALNVTTDLSYFDYIYPCGLDIEMTSIKESTGLSPKLAEVAEIGAEIMIRTLEETKRQTEQK